MGHGVVSGDGLRLSQKFLRLDEVAAAKWHIAVPYECINAFKLIYTLPKDLQCAMMPIIPIHPLAALLGIYCMMFSLSAFC